MRRYLPISILLGLALIAIGRPGHATPSTTIYECVGAAGQVVYQDEPCPPGQHQRTMQVSDAPSSPRPPVPAAPVAPASIAVPAPPPEPTAPLPVMYACIRATDGKTYVSANGNPAPYMVPYGVLGADQQPLSEVYGPDRGGAGISAPEANRGRVTSGLVANNYVQVQDQCRELDAEETCQALQDAWDKNEHKLDNAFQSQRPPLEKREAQLRTQLANCGD